MAMSLDQAVTIARVALRDPNADSYSTASVQEAIRFTLGELARMTRITRASDSVTLPAESDAFDFSELTGFSSDRLVSVRIDNRTVLPVNAERIYKYRVTNADATGRPQKLAFTGPTDAIVYPTADIEYTATVVWSPYYDDQSGEAINIPDHYIRPAIWHGVPAAMRYAERDDMNASPLWDQFMRYVQSIKATTNIEKGVIIADTDSYI